MSSADTAHACSGHAYRHEALFYGSGDEFMAGTLPFIRDAVEAEEPILVVLGERKIGALREALNGQADAVLFADMAEVGTNPARIIPAWQEFVATHGAKGRRLRGIGEPIWAGRSAAELAECQRHEALLNVCFSDPDFWLLCPYDTAALSRAVLEEARRNHPFLSTGAVSEPSSAYPGAGALAGPFDEPLPAPPAEAVAAVVDVEHLRGVRALVERHAAAAGLTGEAAVDLVFVAHELAANSVRHGGGTGTLTVWREPGAVVCEVRDGGHIDDPLVGRVRPEALGPNGRGLWLANQLCELVQIRSFPTGSAVRVHKRIP
jgi:anti-sigma regulatory factor (Ser/Thr protein kinase)